MLKFYPVRGRGGIGVTAIIISSISTRDVAELGVKLATPEAAVRCDIDCNIGSSFTYLESSKLVSLAVYGPVNTIKVFSSRQVYPSRKHAYIILTPLNPTFI